MSIGRDGEDLRESERHTGFLLSLSGGEERPERAAEVVWTAFVRANALRVVT